MEDYPQRAASVRHRLEETWSFETQADGAIYVASPERHLYTRPLHHMGILRRDLIAADRDPERFPVVFEVLRLDYDDPVATEEELATVLRWPWSDRIDTVTGPKVPKEDRRHDVPVRRLLEMIECGPA